MENQYFENTEHSADLDIIESKHVMELISISEEYVKFIANNEKYDKHTIMNYLQKIFPLMYLKGSLIPEITPANEEADERFVTEEEYQHLYLELKAKFSENCDDGHCDCADEADKIAEDLCDIYQDLKDFITLYSKQLLASQECAVRNAREWFIHRWGIHVSQLLVHFHNCIYHINHEHEEEE
jgi:hypothetical protein